MRKYGKEELEILNIQIGCVLRHGRLKKGLSQHELSLSLGTNPTMVGRVERFENVSGWDKVFLISQELGVDYITLFNLKSKEELLTIVDNSKKLEKKLTKEKREYYSKLKDKIIKSFKSLKK